MKTGRNPKSDAKSSPKATAQLSDPPEAAQPPAPLCPDPNDGLSFQQSIMDTASVGILVYQASGQCISANASSAKILGISTEQLLQQNFYQLESWEESGLFEVATKALAAHTEQQKEVHHVTTVGKEVWLVCHFASFRHGSETHLLLTINDITQHNLSEKEIERMNRLYAALSQINECIVKVQSREQLFEEICRIIVDHGRFKMAWIGWLDPQDPEVKVAARHGDVSGYLNNIRIFADDRPEGRGPTGIALREGRTYVCHDFATDPITQPWRAAAARSHFASCIGVPIRLGGGIRGALMVYASEKNFFGKPEVALMEEAALDISFALDHLEQEQKRKQVEEENRQLIVAIDQSAESIVFTDLKGTIRYVNQGFEKITGYSRLEAIGQNPRILKSGQQPPEFYTQLWDALSRGNVWTGHFINQRKDGTRYEEDATITPIRDHTGKITSFVAVKRDITREVQLERQIIETQKLDAIGQLAGGVAHDYNNILAATLIQLGLLMADPGLSPHVREALVSLKKNADRAAKLTRQLLMFSRREAMQKKPLELNALVDDELKMLHRLLGEHIDLMIRGHSSAAWIEADSGMMEQVLMNLCLNARDAMPQGGRLTVGVTAASLTPDQIAHAEARPGDFICLSVADTGCGMSAETISRIFEPFFTTKEIGKGTGLGLATVYGIVKQHQGWIEVGSEPGKGTVFRVYLPASTSATAARSHPHRPKIIPGTGTILLVEDEETVRDSMSQCLKHVGYQVFEAASGPEALQKWSSRLGEIDLLFTDMVMPGGMNGLELAESLLKSKPALPVIITSGYNNEMVQTVLNNRPGFRFLHKPYDLSLLTTTIRQSLSRPQP